MDASSFAFWLHGWCELNGGKRPSPTQWAIIQDHIKLTLGEAKKVSPSPATGVTTGSVSVSSGSNAIVYC